MSKFSKIGTLPPIEVFAVNKAFLDDPFPQKVNLGIGAYRTDDGKPWVLPCVRKMEKLMADDDSLNHEYLPILGLDPFCRAATALVMGRDNPLVLSGLAFGVQCLSGTGSLRVAAEFLGRQLGYTSVYYSNPSWENHQLIFKTAGFSVTKPYRYWEPKSRSLDIEGMLEDFNNANENSVIILHGCAHNPTGVDPTQEQWKRIAEVIKKKNLFTLFDVAYQGFASGDPDKDAWAVRYFASMGLELLVSQSFAKNFGLYNERVGNLVFVVNDEECVAPVKSQVSIIIRAMYSNPPNHGARIVANILNDETLRKEWEECLLTMSGRIKEMRTLLRDKLETLGTPGLWNHVTDQIGMFSYTGLNPLQVEKLVLKYHIYLLKSGRINMCGLNHRNIDYVAKAIYETVIDVESSNEVESKL